MVLGKNASVFGLIAFGTTTSLFAKIGKPGVARGVAWAAEGSVERCMRVCCCLHAIWEPAMHSMLVQACVWASHTGTGDRYASPPPARALQ